MLSNYVKEDVIYEQVLIGAVQNNVNVPEKTVKVSEVC